MSSKTAKIVRLAGVGDILLERSLRARHITITVKPFKGVRIAVPRGVSFQEALAVAQSKVVWLQVHLARMASIECALRERKKEPTINRVQARRWLLERLADLARMHGFSYNKAFVRNQKTRWGSCSHKNNISLNLHLTQLPQRLADYTILHELVHTRVKNHGPLFWAELGKYIPDPKKLDRELNQYWMVLVDAE